MSETGVSPYQPSAIADCLKAYPEILWQLSPIDLRITHVVTSTIDGV